MISNILFRLYAINSVLLRKVIRMVVTNLEGGEYYSTTLRKIFIKYYNVEIGMYTHGSCFIPGIIDRNTKIGRYCSIAVRVRVLNINHPLEFKSTHGFFFNTRLGYCPVDLMDYQPLVIENDVWLGVGAIIMPHVRNIGNGAVVAAGAVVNKDVPPYAVVIGNPARVVRYRFSPETIENLLASKWWEKTINEIKNDIGDYIKPHEVSE
jgi:acetyltransferase-like isoleucine patch superfamily enzyme